MIRMLCLVLVMTVSGTSGYAQSVSGIVVQEEPKCFMCGRTPADFAHIHDQALHAYDESIQELSARIAEIEEHSAVRYRRITEATRNNPNMALAVGTVTTDVETFSRLIPHVTEILEFYEKHGRRLGLGSGPHVRLSDIVAAMEDPPLPELLRAKLELETVEAQRKAYEQLADDFLEFPLFRLTTKFSTVSADLANIEDLKRQNNNRLSRLLSEARSSYKDEKNSASLWSIVEQYKERIFSDPAIRERDRDQLYHSFVAEFLELGKIEYTLYLCPVCLTLLKNSAPSPKYKVWRFNKSTNRRDTTMHDFP